ncbi:unnamed protein product [Peronospora belbahrii]|uniref:Uncharacterized protein n=1 Tax=Peronospora belbahrii TaxID=622444 RepID=A0AAU9L294_9STRA|nr:unnamed protein product [Peronospora belbahrii]CAH0521605.1 unnamed protein product [Peronospora belbahrii]
MLGFIDLRLTKYQVPRVQSFVSVGSRRYLEWYNLDSLSTLARYWLFMQLQFTEKTHINLLNLLDGASVALETTIRATNNQAYPEYLAGIENRSSDVADQLKQYMTPSCYSETALQVKKNYLHRNFHVECEDMKIEKTQLACIMYHRLTEKKYQEWIHFTKFYTGANSSNALIEYLQLGVDVATVEDLTVVHCAERTRQIQHKNVYRVVLESRVTNLDEVDWRIESTCLIEQIELSRPQEISERQES